MSTTPADLTDFVGAPCRFMEPAPGRTLRVSRRYALAADLRSRECLEPGEIDEAVADVAAFPLQYRRIESVRSAR